LRDVRMIEAPSSFEVIRRPVIHIKTVQMREGMTLPAKMTAIRRHDEIALARQDRNGICHTVSFDRARFLQLQSSNSPHMMLHDSKGTARTVDEFKRTATTNPRELVSPSVMTGFDFPGATARWQVIFKIPFMPRSPIVDARLQLDPNYIKFAAVVDFIQACGRIVRGISDFGETFCTDDQILWLYPEAVRMGWIPFWFMPAVVLNVKNVPPPINF